MADREAFDAYVRERWAPSLRTATLLTGDRHSAEDLVQETLVRAAQHWTRVDPAAADAYVRRILYTRSVDAWRWRRHQPDPVDGAGHEGSGAVDATDAADTRLTLAAALRRLTPRQRAVLVARFYEDRTEVQAARGARLLGEHREVADPPRLGAATGAGARACRHLRSRGDPAMTADRWAARVTSSTTRRRPARPVPVDLWPPADGVASARWPSRPS